MSPSAACADGLLDVIAKLDELEAATGQRHEWYGGRFVAMAGATIRHATIVLNIGTGLRGVLRGKPCLPLLNAVRLQVEATGELFYPDVLVLCGAALPRDGKATSAKDATIVVEVQSPTTEATDRGRKRRAYRQLPGLAAYVLVSQADRLVEVLETGSDFGWTVHEYLPGESLRLPGIDVTLAVDDLYADTDTPVAVAPVLRADATD